jgi:hypothetical protein
MTYIVIHGLISQWIVLHVTGPMCLSVLNENPASFPKVGCGTSSLLKCHGHDETVSGHPHLVCGNAGLLFITICHAPGKHVLGRQVPNQICEHHDH